MIDKYSHLENLLITEQWKEADQETRKLILQSVGREKQGWLNHESIINFPSEDLVAIDQLWVKYSRFHFGFSVQKKIWLKVGTKVDYKTESKLGDQVGWRNRGVEKSYDDLTFSLQAPLGHLPRGFGGLSLILLFNFLLDHPEL